MKKEAPAQLLSYKLWEIFKSVFFEKKKPLGTCPKCYIGLLAYVANFIKASQDTSKMLWRPLGIHKKCYKGLLGHLKNVMKAFWGMPKMLRGHFGIHQKYYARLLRYLKNTSTSWRMWKMLCRVLGICHKCYKRLLGHRYAKNVIKASWNKLQKLQRLLGISQTPYEGLSGLRQMLWRLSVLCQKHYKGLLRCIKNVIKNSRDFSKML